MILVNFKEIKKHIWEDYVGEWRFARIEEAQAFAEYNDYIIDDWTEIKAEEAAP